MGANLSPCKGKSFKKIRQFTKLLPLQGALLTVIIPRALPWAKSFCPFRACCLLGVLLVWTSALAGRAACWACCLYGLLPLLSVLLAGRAACMGFCPFRACCLYELLPLLSVLLVWASALTGGVMLLKLTSSVLYS